MKRLMMLATSGLVGLLAACITPGQQGVMAQAPINPQNYSAIASDNNPIGYIEITLTKRAGGNTCVVDTYFENKSQYEVSFAGNGKWHVNYTDRYGNPLARDYFWPDTPLTPGRSTQITDFGPVPCDTRMARPTPGAPNEWPNVCQVNRRPTSPCPIGVIFRSNDFTMQR